MSEPTEALWSVHHEGGIELTDPAVRALAERLVAIQVAHGGWLDWGDVPNLSERTFTALAEEVDRIGAQMYRTLRSHDRDSGIDSAFLDELAQGGPDSGSSSADS